MRSCFFRTCGLEKSYHRHRRLLCARRERPRCRAADQRDELAPVDYELPCDPPAGVMPMQWGTLPRFDCAVCGKSAYPPRLSFIADIPLQRPGANNGPEQVRQVVVGNRAGY
jgi:hypothetical protein